MERKEFIRQCGLACLGAVGVSLLTESCTPANQINAPIRDNRLMVDLSEFESGKGNEMKFKRYVIVRNDQLNFPIVVYRENEKEYTALLLRCSHQYNELNVNGELLTCAAHGSEFDSKGNIVTGPADTKLRSFSTSLDQQHLYINLV
jgi:Rieske Fe-S protein